VLRVTVTRERPDESVAIGEVVIGKFAGTEQRGGYAARVFEPPSPYSEGIDACFTVRGHERYQPAMALVASVLAAWREGRVDSVSDGIRAALTGAAGTKAAPPASLSAAPPASLPAAAPVSAWRDPTNSVAERAARALVEHRQDPAMSAMAEAILAISEKINQV
jgi:hypothetical protein